MILNINRVPIFFNVVSLLTCSDLYIVFCGTLSYLEIALNTFGKSALSHLDLMSITNVKRYFYGTNVSSTHSIRILNARHEFQQEHCEYC